MPRTSQSPEGLSVCCLTADPPGPVAAALSLLRAVADEIVVAVDSRVDPAGLGPLVEVADTAVRFEYTDPPESARPWLVSRCRGPWVLMIDGDEVPGGELLAGLGELRAGPETQVRLSRRWCFPDERHWLAERPWWPDFQRRLFRTGAALDFDLQVHGGVIAATPARYTTAPLYHLACLQTPFAERRRRARRYEGLRPGLLAVGGGPMNETLYGPEHFATLRPAPTPDDDVERIRTVLEARTPEGLAPRLPLVTAAEVAAHRPPDAFAAHGYQVALRVVEVDCRTEPGHDTLVLVEVTNEGAEPLPHQDRTGVQIRVGARVRAAGSGAVVAEGARTPLPGDVPVGASRLVEAHVPVPAAEGRYEVEFDLVNERARWFGCPVRAPLAVATRWGRYRL